MVRVFYALIALGGVAVVVANKQFAEASQRSSARDFGRVVRPGSGEQRFMILFSRGLAVVVGAALLVLGTLGALGIIWQE